MARATYVATVIDKAADLIRRNGLHKGAFWPGADPDEHEDPSEVRYRSGMPLCSWGALAVASGTYDVNAEVVQQAQNHIRLHLPEVAHSEEEDAFGLRSHTPAMADWNDADERTADEVVEVFRAAARSLR